MYTPAYSIRPLADNCNMDTDDKKDSMTPARRGALKKFTSKRQTDLLLDSMETKLRQEAEGFLSEYEWEEVFRNTSRNNNANKFSELTRILCTKTNGDFDRFVTILEKPESGYGHYAEELRKEFQQYQNDMTASQYEKDRLLELDDVHVSDVLVCQGTFGNMYRAEWLDSDCIVKTFKDIDESQVKYVKREIHYCALFLKHRNIVQIYGLLKSEEIDGFSVVMERLCIRLDDFLTDHKANRDSVPLKVKRSILRDVASGMRYLHDKSIIHRNLNAESIMLTSSMVAKICDLGMARELIGKPGKYSKLIVKEFSAPEMQGQNYGPPCDYFSFGCLIIHVMIHEAPKRKDHFGSEYKQRQHHLEGIDLSKYEELPELVHDCLKNRPRNRSTFDAILQRIPKGYSDEDAFVDLDSILGNPAFSSDAVNVQTAVDSIASPKPIQAPNCNWPSWFFAIAAVIIFCVVVQWPAPYA